MTINLDTATRQEVFDYVCDHLKKQDRQASFDNGACQYLTPDGLKCAVGCLIPSSYYNPEFENLGTRLVTQQSNPRTYNHMSGEWVHVKIPERLDSFIKRHRDLLTYLQNVHDSYSNWNEMCVRLAVYALNNDLVFKYNNEVKT